MDRRELYSLTGSIVRISAPGDDRVLLFSMESAAGDSAVLRPCNSESRDFASVLEPGAPLTLTAGAFDGVVHGDLTVDRWAKGPRMLLVNNPPLEFAQRREAFRVRASIPVEVLVADPSSPAGSRMVRGETYDLSLGGCAVTAAGAQLEAGASTLMVLHTERQPIIVVVEVLGRHPDAKHTFRVRLTQVNPFEQTVLSAELRRLEVSKVSAQRAPVRLR